MRRHERYPRLPHRIIQVSDTTTGEFAMPLVKSYDEIENPRIQRNLPNGHFGWRSDFIQRPEDKSVDTPMAFLAEGSPHRVLRTHFHVVDQFQVMYNGSGAL